MDDTIEYLIPAWCTWLNAEHNLNVKPSDITDWEITQFFPTLSKDEVFKPTHTEMFWNTVYPMRDAQIRIKQLIDDGHEVFIVTSSYVDTIEWKYKYIISEFFPYIKWENMVICGRKQIISGDVLIDDGVHNLVGGTYDKFLMSAPHNMSYNAEANGMTRVNNWDEIYELIKKKGEVYERN